MTSVRFLSAFMRSDGVATESISHRMRPVAHHNHPETTPGYFESLPRHHTLRGLQSTLSAQSPLFTFLYRPLWGVKE